MAMVSYCEFTCECGTEMKYELSVPGGAYRFGAASSISCPKCKKNHPVGDRVLQYWVKREGSWALEQDNRQPEAKDSDKTL